MFVKTLYKKMTMTAEIPLERHPFEPFVPTNATILMLGTFPPKPERWSMPFYYPNKINDMWRAMGIVFFGDRDRFWDAGAGKFRQKEIEDFLREKGIALYDTAVTVRRLRDNASDKFLDIVEPLDLVGFFARCPSIAHVVTTGEKATQVVADIAQVPLPRVGESEDCIVAGHRFTLWRMPSTSRAYPLALERKADAYRRLFTQTGLLR